MRFEREARLDATLEELWAQVDDLQALGGCVPGARQVRVTGPSTFDVEMVQQVGPIGLTFELGVRVAELRRPNRAVIDIEGGDRRLGARVRQHQELTFEAGEAGTIVRIVADVSVTGRLATFGQRVIDAKAQELMDGMIANIEALVIARRGGGTAAAQAPGGGDARRVEGDAPG